MSFDVSEARQLVQDLIRMADDFRVHDPDLAREFATKAQEIDRDLGLEVNLTGHTTSGYNNKALATIAAAGQERHNLHHAADLTGDEGRDAEEDDDRLSQILGHQRALLESRDGGAAGARANGESRDKSTGWSVLGSWLRPESV